MAQAAGVVDFELEELALFRGSPDGFTEARNALAKRVRQGGDRPNADRIKALSKPSAVAWAVNQLYWNARPISAAVDAAREAVHSALAGGRGVTEALAARKSAVRAAVDAALGFLEAAGHGVGPAVLRDLSATVEALATQPPPGWRAGCLQAALEAPGFDALSAFASALPEPPARPAQRPALTVLSGGMAPRATPTLTGPSATQERSAVSPEYEPGLGAGEQGDAPDPGAPPPSPPAGPPPEERARAQRREEAMAVLRSAEGDRRLALEAYGRLEAAAELVKRALDTTEADVRRLEGLLVEARSVAAGLAGRAESARADVADARQRVSDAQRGVVRAEEALAMV